MLTPQQEKLFRFIYRLGKSYGLDVIEFDIEFDNYLSDDPFDISDFNSFYTFDGSRSYVEIPEKAAQQLTDFINENVQPKLQDIVDEVYDENSVDDISQITLKVLIDINSRKFDATLQVGWYGEETPSEDSEVMPDEIFNEIQANVPEANAVKAVAEYSGGGDDGDLGSEIEISTQGGQNYLVPLEGETRNWVSNNLPGGWEIDYGSQGKVIFDLEEKKIDIYHTWNTYDNTTKTVLEFEF